MSEDRKRARYVLPTGPSLLFSRVMEAIVDHKLDNDYKYDHFPLYALSEAINDQNTVLILLAHEGGIMGQEGNV